MQNPILIASPTRSGTTMLAWLLHLHGVWIGNAGVTKSPETNPQVGTENISLKKYLKSINGVPENFKEQIEKRVETNGPWLLKTAGNLMKQDIWLKYYPDAIWLLPWRSIDKIVESAMRHPGMRRTGKEQRIKIAEYHRGL